MKGRRHEMKEAEWGRREAVKLWFTGTTFKHSFSLLSSLAQKWGGGTRAFRKALVAGGRVSSKCKDSMGDLASA